MRRGITSGHKWYQTLPEDWEERKIQYSSKVYSGGTPDRNNPDYWEEGIIPWLTSGEINKKVILYSDNFITELASKESSTRWVTSGAVLMAMNGQGKTKATVALLEFDSTINQSLCSINLDEEHNNRFVYYFLEGRYSQIRGLVGEDREGLNLSTIKSIVLPLPPLETQKRIANFLDKETTRIDTLISKKQKQVELLQEKRQAIITHAVTKGLNPDVKMKDSGVKWIGEIPEHWELRRLKFCIEGNLKYGANESAEDDNSENPRYIRITDFGDDGKLRDDTFKSLVPEIAKDYLLKNGDVLFARSGATVGKTFIYRESVGKSCFAGYLIKASSKRDLLEPEFLYLYTNSNSYLNWKNSIFIQATIQNIGADKYSNLQLPLPPIVEQNKILEKVLSETNRVEVLIEKLIKSIDLLKEYRSSLITHAVSGQIDITQYEVSK